MDTSVSQGITMLNTSRNQSMRGARLTGLLAAVLLAGSGATMGATVPVSLCATTGTTTLPDGASVPVWGYTADCAAVNAPGGPTIYANAGDTVQVTLTNNLPEATGLLFHGQGMVLDTTGIASGSTTYTITATQPGTFLYEAALLPNAEHQAAMGLYGALVVRPSDATFAPIAGTSMGADPTGLTLTDSTASFPTTLIGETLNNKTDGSNCVIASVTSTSLVCAARLSGGTNNAWAVGDAYSGPSFAYGSASAAYNDEAVLVLSELDPALNNSTDPTAFDLRNVAPKYFLINGKAYPDTATLPSAANDKVLLRYVNAGAKHHSMAVLGLRQSFIAKDASPLPTADVAVVAETLAPGQTADAIATIPAAATTDSKFAVYDGSLLLHNNGAAGFGGMLTFVTAGTGSAALGPATRNVALTPNPTNGTVTVALSATVSSASSTVDAVEYFIDATGAGGAGTAMVGTTTASASISLATLASLGSGNHTFYVHGHDTAGNWGAFSSAVLSLDKTGPTTGGLTLSPNPSNGSVSVALSGTGNDTASGNSNVVAAQYRIDRAPATAMTMGSAPAPVRGFTATIPSGLAAGAHTIAVRSRDALGNWGASATITLNVVATGPVASHVNAVPNPNNGALPLSSSQPVVRVTATLTSTGSAVAGAEGFVDTAGAPGSGFPFVPSDGQWSSATEIGYADIPLATVNALSSGNHTIFVRGKDAVGNWGATSTTTLLIDRTAPAINGVTPSPATVAFGTLSVTLSVTASDTGGAGVTGGQYWIDGTATPPATAKSFVGTNPAIDTSTLAGGTHTVYVQVRDAAGNWSTAASVTLYVVQAVNDTNTFSANNNATQTIGVGSGSGLLVNDQPTGVAGRVIALASAPVRTSGTGAGTLTLSCVNSLGTSATPPVSGQTICTNGAYRVTLHGVGNNNAQRNNSKVGTFTFTYTETLNGVTSTAAVTIAVNP